MKTMEKLYYLRVGLVGITDGYCQGNVIVF